MGIFTFNKTRDAIKAEKLCKDMALNYRIIPVPRSISANCGMAVEVSSDDMDRLSLSLENNNIEAKAYN